MKGPVTMSPFSDSWRPWSVFMITGKGVAEEEGGRWYMVGAELSVFSLRAESLTLYRRALRIVRRSSLPPSFRRELEQEVRKVAVQEGGLGGVDGLLRRMRGGEQDAVAKARFSLADAKRRLEEMEAMLEGMK